jgi:transcriptional regulator with XRE-family HTH domain
VTIGSALRTRRESLGLSMNEMTTRTRLHHETIEFAECGMSNPTLGTLERIAQALCCHVEVRLVDDRTGEEVQ